jgi:DNA-binding transcriptional LysR family regulator
LLEQFDNYLHRARSIQEGKSGTLRIGLIGAERIDERALNLFDKFQEKYPGVDLLLRRGSHSELIKWLYNKTIDLSFSLKVDVMDKEGLDYRYLYNVDSVLILNAAHPLAKREGLTLSDFKDETFVNISANESPIINAMLKQECERPALYPNLRCGGHY